MNPQSHTPAREPIVWKSDSPQYNPVAEWLAWIEAGTLHGIISIPAQEPSDD